MSSLPLYILSRVAIFTAILVAISFILSIFSPQPLPTFSLWLFFDGLILILGGGAMGAGIWEKRASVHWMRSIREAARAEREYTSRRESTLAGIAFAIVGIVLVILSLYMQTLFPYQLPPW